MDAIPPVHSALPRIVGGLPRLKHHFWFPPKQSCSRTFSISIENARNASVISRASSLPDRCVRCLACNAMVHRRAHPISATLKYDPPPHMMRTHLVFMVDHCATEEFVVFFAGCQCSSIKFFVCWWWVFAHVRLDCVGWLQWNGCITWENWFRQRLLADSLFRWDAATFIASIENGVRRYLSADTRVSR